MKKWMVLLLALALVMCCSCAMAAGQLKVTRENCSLITGESFGDYIAVFARVENVGDAPVLIGEATVTYYDEKGRVLVDADPMNMLGELLQPGEYTYLFEQFASDPEMGLDITLAYDYRVTVAAAAEDEPHDQLDRLQMEAGFVASMPSGMADVAPTACMVGTVTNPYDDVLFSTVYVLMTLLDQDDNILYCDFAWMDAAFALLPGDSLSVKLNVPDHILSLADEMGQVPTRVDAIAYQWR